MDLSNIRKALVLLNVDNGAHLLDFYGAGPTMEQCINIQIAEASNGFSPMELIQIDMWLGQLSEEDLEIFTQGEVTDRELLCAPTIAEDFIQKAFDTELVNYD